MSWARLLLVSVFWSRVYVLHGLESLRPSGAMAALDRSWSGQWLSRVLIVQGGPSSTPRNIVRYSPEDRYRAVYDVQRVGKSRNHPFMV